MRDILIIIILVVLLPLTVRFPVVGLFLWEWLALMNPHRMAYGFAMTAPLNMIVAFVTVPAWLLSTEKVKLKFDLMCLLFLLFTLWMCLTTFASPLVDIAEPFLERNLKTMLFVLLVLTTVTTPARVHGFIWIAALAIGFYGVRGAGFMAMTGGNYIVNGPPDTMMGDNNGLGCALNLALPLLNYLRLRASRKFLRLGLLGMMLACLMSVLGTYSRGALVTLLPLLGYLWLKSRAKLPLFLAACVGLGVAFAAMPDRYFDRINTIKDAEQDESFMGRVEAWKVAYHVALDRPLGAGFDVPRQVPIWNLYGPEGMQRASHSIYFMVLGEQGFIGLFMYLALIALALGNLRKTAKICADRPELAWLRDLASNMQVSIVGFCIGGSLLPMAYYDAFLVLIALTTVLKQMALRHVEEGGLTEALRRPDRRPPHPEPLPAPA